MNPGTFRPLFLLLLSTPFMIEARTGPGSNFSLEAGGMAGYHGNPRYLNPDDSLHAASPLLQADISGKWRYLGTERWDLRASLAGGSKLYPSALEGDINGLQAEAEGRFHLADSRPGDKPRESSYLALAYRSELSDNSILSNPDRSDPDAPALGYGENRLRFTAQYHTGGLGAWRGEASILHRNYGESVNLLASLDSHQEEAALEWLGPRWGMMEMDLGYAVSVRNYFEYPARDLRGDTVAGSGKSLLTHGPQAGVKLNLGRKTDLRLEYAMEVQRDLHAGYFDCYSHSPSVSFKTEPSKAWEFTLRGWSTWELYDHYRVGYSSRRPLKRIRYDFLRARLERGFGRFYAEAEALYRGEENNTPAYRYYAPSAGAGVGIKL